MNPQPGEIWLANIPFTNGLASKIRPILALWLDAADIVVAAVTSAQPRSAADVALLDWISAGLRVPSTVRLSRLDCLEQSLLQRKLGVVSAGDALRIHQTWLEQIKLQF
jgi:mRNA interferase MazF